MQRNVSDFGIFNLVEVLKKSSQKGFEKKERMQGHLQQSSSMEETVGEPRGWYKGIVR